MAVAVTMPQMGESVVEGTVARWLKAPGDPVAKLEPLLEISTDKIDTEVPSPAAGTLLQVVVDAGKTVRAGTVLAYIGAAGETPAGETQVARFVPAPAITTAGVATPSYVDESAQRPVARPSGRDYISPVVGRMVQEHGLELAQIVGSGLNGRVTKQDVLAHLAQRTEAVSSTATAAIAAQNGEDLREPLTPMRRMIAEHMVRSKATSPHVTTVFEADMAAVVRHRETHKAAYAVRGVRLTYTPYFVAAAAQALRLTPEINARFDGAGEQSALDLVVTYPHRGGCGLGAGLGRAGDSRCGRTQLARAGAGGQRTGRPGAYGHTGAGCAARRDLHHYQSWGGGKFVGDADHPPAAVGDSGSRRDCEATGGACDKCVVVAERRRRHRDPAHLLFES